VLAVLALSVVPALRTPLAIPAFLAILGLLTLQAVSAVRTLALLAVSAGRTLPTDSASRFLVTP
jgi:hypothetical protein